MCSWRRKRGFEVTEEQIRERYETMELSHILIATVPENGKTPFPAGGFAESRGSL